MHMYLTPLSIGSGYSVVTGASQVQSGPKSQFRTYSGPFMALGPNPDQVRNSKPYRSHWLSPLC